MKKMIILLAFASFATGAFSDVIATFDGQSTTGNNTYYRPNTDGTYNWSDNNIGFNMTVAYSGVAWDGMTYSSVNDITTSGYLNQYAVWGDGKDRSGTGSYSIFYQPYTARNIILFPTPTRVNGFYVNNTTYAALDMQNGSSFSRAFTTASNDWFKLTIEGFDAGGSTQGTKDFLLADYTGATGSIVSDWSFVDLTGLGDNVSSLGFTLTSSDNSQYGMNTPAYFAMDDLSVENIPEPGSLILILSGAGGLFFFRRLQM